MCNGIQRIVGMGGERRGELSRWLFHWRLKSIVEISGKYIAVEERWKHCRINESSRSVCSQKVNHVKEIYIFWYKTSWALDWIPVWTTWYHRGPSFLPSFINIWSPFSVRMFGLDFEVEGERYGNIPPSWLNPLMTYNIFDVIDE